MDPPLIARATNRRDRTAIRSAEGAFTYGELLDASSRFATALLDGAADLDEGRVAFLIPPSFAHVAVQWAIWRAGFRLLKNNGENLQPMNDSILPGPVEAAKIMEYLPHRYPFLLIDRVLSMELEPEKRLIAMKNISINEPFFNGHFPGNPVFPGVLMIESMAQTAGILVGTVRRFTEKVILAKINLAEVEADVFPGQTIRYEAELERIDDAGAATRGVIRRLDHRGDENDLTWRTIGRVNLMFSHADQNMAGMEFPDENFVFSDNFRTILRTAGLADLAPC